MSERVTLYTREGCHLCVDARATVARECEAAGVEWSEVDITRDQGLTDIYGDEIPVVVVDGEVVGFWRINADLLRLALS